MIERQKASFRKIRFLRTVFSVIKVVKVREIISVMNNLAQLRTKGET